MTQPPCCLILAASNRNSPRGEPDAQRTIRPPHPRTRHPSHEAPPARRSRRHRAHHIHSHGLSPIHPNGVIRRNHLSAGPSHDDLPRYTRPRDHRDPTAAIAPCNGPIRLRPRQRPVRTRRHLLQRRLHDARPLQLLRNRPSLPWRRVLLWTKLRQRPVRVRIKPHECGRASDWASLVTY
jgi:hypothetical protein